MIILFSTKFADAITELTHDQRFLECADNLSIAHRKGMHVVGGPPTVIRTIGEALGGDARGVFAQIAKHYHEQRSLIDSVTHYTIVEPRADGTISRCNDDTRICFQVPFSYFSQFESIQPSRFIAEDATDCKMVESVLRGFCYHYRRGIAKTLAVKLQGFGGGGSSTKDQFADHARKGPTYALVDSDRHSPWASLGDTAASLVKSARDIENEAISHVEILNCHEMENLLPIRLLEDVMNEDDSQELRTRWLSLCKLISTQGIPDISYIDLKNGLCQWDIFAQSDMTTRGYMTRIATSLPTTNSCVEQSCKKREECKCVHVPALGATALERATEHLQKQTGQKTAEYFFSEACHSRELWDALLRILFSWGCAPRPIRS